MRNKFSVKKETMSIKRLKNVFYFIFKEHKHYHDKEELTIAG